MSRDLFAIYSLPFALISLEFSRTRCVCGILIAGYLMSSMHIMTGMPSNLTLKSSLKMENSTLNEKLNTKID